MPDFPSFFFFPFSNQLLDRYTETLEKLSNLEKVANSRRGDADSLSREKDTLQNKLHDALVQLEAQTAGSKAEIDKLKKENGDTVEQLSLQVGIFSSLFLLLFFLHIP